MFDKISDELILALMLLVIGVLLIWRFKRDTSNGWTTQGPFGIKRKNQPVLFWFVTLFLYLGLGLFCLISGVSLLILNGTNNASGLLLSETTYRPLIFCV